jgi:hypothetical protein
MEFARTRKGTSSRIELRQQGYDLLWLMPVMSMTSFLPGGFSHSTWYKKAPVTSFSRCAL